MSREKSLANTCQLATLRASPVVKDMRNTQAAEAAGMPTEIRIGRTMEPTMMMDPRPDRVVNSSAVATAMMRVTTRGRPPPSSALFLMMVSVTPVRFISCPSHAPKTTAMIAEAIFTVPPSKTPSSSPVATPWSSLAISGTPAMRPMRPMPTPPATT